MDYPNNEVNVVDVRAAEYYAEGHIPGAVDLPKDLPRWETVEGLRRDKLNVLYCDSHVCHLAAATGVEFSDKSFSVKEMDGGMRAWREYELDIEK